MTDNNEERICFMCEYGGFDVILQPHSNVWLCHPCIDDLDAIRAEVVGV